MKRNTQRTRRKFLKSCALVAGASATAGVSADALAEEQGGYVIAPVGTPSIDVAGSDKRFPLRRIYCLGRNYSAHAIEMGDDPDESPPFFFMKPADTAFLASEGFPYPTMSNRVSYEMELVVALESGGANIDEGDALRHVFGYGVGLDMTRRDLQDVAKERSRPWDGSKGFDQSTPMSAIYPVSDVGHPEDNRIWLSVNDEIRQDSTTALMRWSIAESIAILSQYFELHAGDIILTGTPAGVGLVERGDTMRGGVEGVAEIEVAVV